MVNKASQPSVEALWIGSATAIYISQRPYAKASRIGINVCFSQSLLRVEVLRPTDGRSHHSIFHCETSNVERYNQSQRTQ